MNLELFHYSICCISGNPQAIGPRVSNFLQDKNIFFRCFSEFKMRPSSPFICVGIVYNQVY